MTVRHAVGFLLAVIVLAVAAFFLGSAVRYATYQALSGMGIAATGGTVSIGLDRAEIAHMALSGHDTISVAATYSLGGLIGGKFQTLEITDVALHGTIGPDGSFVIDSYRPNPDRPKTETPVALPAERARIAHAVFLLDTPVGPVAITGKGDLTEAAGTLHLVGDATAVWGEFKVAAPLKFDYAPKGWTVDLDPIRSDKMAGTVAFHAAAKGTDFRATGTGTVRFKDFGIAAGGFSADGINGSVAFTRFSPLATAKAQNLTAKRLVFAQQLDDASVEFAIQNTHTIAIADAHGGFMGGTVAIRGQTVDWGADEQSLTIAADGVDVAQMLALANLKGLSGSGKLDGTLPIRHKKDMLRIEDGELHATEPGILQYDPADSPSALQGGQEVTILREVLKDFHYQKMTIGITGEFGGDEEIKMALTGANPSLYGGKAVELNLNFTGALDSIARFSVQSFKTPLDAIRKPVKPVGGQRK